MNQRARAGVASPSAPHPDRRPLIAAVFLLALFALLTLTSMARLAITGDEVTHLPAGYSYLVTGDFRLNPQHPPLIKALAGVPLLALDLAPVEQTAGWPGAREWVFGRHFLVENRTPLARIVFWGRVPMVLIGVLLGAVLYAWARALWGEWPGVFVLFLYVCCPNFLAHAPIVHTDVGVTCFTVVALAALWRYGRERRLRDALWCGIGLGMALLSKYSGLVTAGVVLVLFVVTALRPVAGAREADERDATRPHRAALLIGLVPLVMITLAFGFPRGLANYVHGARLIHADLNPHWEAFLWGAYSKDGFWYYYLLAQLWKTPLPTLLCFAAALCLLGRDQRATRLDWWFILLPFAAFHAAGMWQRASIGVRHVLPAFPFMMLACGATARWIGRQQGAVRLGFAALCVWLAAGTLRMYPHFLPYFNELAGGPAGGAYHLDDSNVEWGQALAAAAAYLDARRPAAVRMLAFEPLDRAVYGIDAPRMALRDVVWPEPGVTYLVGASTLQRSSLFNDRPGVRFEWLDRYRPIDQIGWSIDVFRFSTDPADAERGDVLYVPRAEWYATAIGRLSGMVARWPDFTAARELLADVYADRAGWRETQGDADGALRDAFNAASVARRGTDKTAFRAAVLRLAPAVTIDDAPLEAAFRAAAAACGERLDGECVLALLRCAKRAPRDLRACLNLGSVYAESGLPGLAEREWQRCLAIDPQFAPAHENLARLHARQAPDPENHR